MFEGARAVLEGNERYCGILARVFLSELGMKLGERAFAVSPDRDLPPTLPNPLSDAVPPS